MTIAISGRLLSEYFITALVAVGVYLISAILMPMYQLGDQEFYRKFYELAEGASFSQAFELAWLTLSSGEFGYPALVWFFSGILDKDVFVSISNAFLAVVFLRVGRRLGGNLLLLVLVVLTNFYLYVLYFGAERLKYAVLFALLGFLVWQKTGSRLRGAFFGVLGVLFHSQILILIASFFSFFLVDFFRQFLRPKILAAFFLFLGIASVLAFYLQDYWLLKLVAYGEGRDPFDIMHLSKVILISALIFYYSKYSGRVLLAMIPFFVANAFVGSSRILILMYFVLMFYGLRVRGGMSFGLILVNLYFSLQSIDFVANIMSFGSGFPLE